MEKEYGIDINNGIIHKQKDHSRNESGFLPSLKKKSKHIID